MDKNNSDENGWCRHDPVSFVTTDPSEGMGELLKTLARGQREREEEAKGEGSRK